MPGEWGGTGRQELGGLQLEMEKRQVSVDSQRDLSNQVWGGGVAQYYPGDGAACPWRGLCLSRHGSSVTRGRQARPGSGRSLPAGRRAQLPTHCLFSADFAGLLFFPNPLTGWLSSPSIFPASPSHCTTRPSTPARSPGGSTRSPRSSPGGRRITPLRYMHLVLLSRYSAKPSRALTLSDSPSRPPYCLGN